MGVMSGHATGRAMPGRWLVAGTRRRCGHLRTTHQPPAMAFDDLAHQGQADPGAASLPRPRCIHAVQPLPNERQLVGRNVRPRC